jgi:hypothetical protein
MLACGGKESRLAGFSALPSNEEPRRKQRGIFVGAEIYFTGGVHTSFVLLRNSYSQKIQPRQAAGYEPPPTHSKLISVALKRVNLQ